MSVFEILHSMVTRGWKITWSHDGFELAHEGNGVAFDIFNLNEAILAKELVGIILDQSTTIED